MLEGEAVADRSGGTADRFFGALVAEAVASGGGGGAIGSEAIPVDHGLACLGNRSIGFVEDLSGFALDLDRIKAHGSGGL